MLAIQIITVRISISHKNLRPHALASFSRLNILKCTKSVALRILCSPIPQKSSTLWTDHSWIIHTISFSRQLCWNKGKNPFLCNLFCQYCFLGTIYIYFAETKEKSTFFNLVCQYCFLGHDFYNKWIKAEAIPVWFWELALLAEPPPLPPVLFIKISIHKN